MLGSISKPINRNLVSRGRATRPTAKYVAQDQVQLSHQVRLANGQRFPIPGDGSPVKVGAGNSCEIRIDNEYVSSSHAYLAVYDGQLHIMDDHSTNGTWIEGRRIQPREWVALPPGYEVNLSTHPEGMLAVCSQADVYHRSSEPETPTRRVQLKGGKEIRADFTTDGRVKITQVGLRISDDQLSRRLENFAWRDGQGRSIESPSQLKEQKNGLIKKWWTGDEGGGFKPVPFYETVGDVEHTRAYLGQDQAGNHLFGYVSEMEPGEATRMMDNMESVSRHQEARSHEAKKVKEWGQAYEGNCMSVAVIKAALYKWGEGLFEDYRELDNGDHRVVLRDGYTCTVTARDVQVHRQKFNSFKGYEGASREQAEVAFVAMAKRYGEQMGRFRPAARRSGGVRPG